MFGDNCILRTFLFMGVFYYFYEDATMTKAPDRGGKPTYTASIEDATKLLECAAMVLAPNSDEATDLQTP